MNQTFVPSWLCYTKRLWWEYVTKSHLPGAEFSFLMNTLLCFLYTMMQIVLLHHARCWRLDQPLNEIWAQKKQSNLKVKKNKTPLEILLRLHGISFCYSDKLIFCLLLSPVILREEWQILQWVSIFRWPQIFPFW